MATKERAFNQQKKHKSAVNAPIWTSAWNPQEPPCAHPRHIPTERRGECWAWPEIAGVEPVSKHRTKKAVGHACH